MVNVGTAVPGVVVVVPMIAANMVLIRPATTAAAFKLDTIMSTRYECLGHQRLE